MERMTYDALTGAQIADREAATRDACRKWGREVLSTWAVSQLYGLTTPAIKKAIAADRVGVSLSFQPDGRKPVDFISLSEVLEAWGEPEKGVVDAMREAGNIISVAGAAWVLLSYPSPLVIERTGQMAFGPDAFGPDGGAG